MEGQVEALKTELGMFGMSSDGKEAFALREKNSLPWANSSRPAFQPLTVFYGGKVFVYNGLPEEKVREIMVIAATAAAASKVQPIKMVDPAGGPLLARSLSLQSTANALPTAQASVHPMDKPSLVNFEAELPIARRHSLQRFLAKRRDRLVSNSPYSEASGKQDAWKDEFPPQEDESKAKTSGNTP